ncbi:deaminase, partial [Streptomyces abyssalis]
MSQLLRVQNFTVSSDGFGSGEGQSLEKPFGHADPGKLFAWAIATDHPPVKRSEPGG